MLLILTSCGTAVSNQPAFVELTGTPNDTNISVKNNCYQLSLNATNYGVCLTKLATGETWGTSPADDGEQKFDELGMPITRHPLVESAIKVIFKNAESRTDDILMSYSDAVQNGNVNVRKFINGFTVEYYFNDAEIMIPVNYELLEDSVRVSINPKKIQENKNRVVKISLAPFWASAKNDTKDSYLFVPSGSGALIDVNTQSVNGLNYSGQVYGTDGTIKQAIISSENKEIRLPVFGAKNGNSGSFAIIEKGAESSYISSVSGSSLLGYSSVYADFQVRGYTNHVAKFFNSTESESRLYSAPQVKNSISVLFYPLSGDEANYSKMAEIYRNYLDEKHGKTENITEHPLNLTLLGGKMISKSFFGIPYQSLSPLTTASQALEIVEKVDRKLVGNFQIKLEGYTESGVDVGRIGGGFETNKKLGKSSEFKELFEFFNRNKIDYYFDYDIVRFNQSDSFLIQRDAVFNVGELKAVQYDYDNASKSKIENSEYYLLSPRKLKEAGEKILKKTKNNPFEGIALSTLSNTSYSDYRNKNSADYYSKSGMTNQAAEVFKMISKNGKKLLSSDANVYAAVLSDTVVEVPISSTNDYSFSRDIPFYAMVLKGRVPLYIQSINCLPDSKSALLRAIECGMGIGYTVINEWNNLLISSQNIPLYNCSFSDLEDDLIKNALVISNILEKTNGSKITTHEILASGLRKTTFENGTVIYVNDTDTAIVTSDGEVKSQDYLVLETLK